MKKPTEKELDISLEENFKSSKEFGNWFLSKTKFKNLELDYVWSRSNYPYGKSEVTVLNTVTGLTELTSKEGETDVLVVFQGPDQIRVALHIENKLVSGRFTDLQPELYAARAEKWKLNSRYGNYGDWESVLIAHQSFYDRNLHEAKKFNTFISHEEIGTILPVFSIGSGQLYGS